jgi:flagellar hook assembly protein FlgD
MRPLLAALVALLAAPGVAFAATDALVVRELPLHGSRSLYVHAPVRFDLVGLHWRGTGSVVFRTRDSQGHWGSWQPVAPEGDRPDARSPEGSRTRGWQLGSPYWTGPSDAIEYRATQGVSRLRAYFVRTAATRTSTRTLSVAGSPPIITRSSWGANESIRRTGPVYADAVHFAIVHHTAGSNSYGPGDSAAIVRGIELYHVLGNGWHDIGYNFLVDRYGQVFEGRYGGIDRPVMGAHAQGFNWGSVGVAVIGNYEGTSLPAAARASLVKLLAWRLDLAHVDPLSTVTRISNGNPRYPAGTAVVLRAVSGHRDTGPTSCPGTGVYAQLPGIARAVASTGLPKLYAPAAAGKLGGLVRFTARVSLAASWTVTVTDSLGDVVGTGSGSGKTVDWIWDATAAAPGVYSYAIETPGARSATGTVGAPLTVASVAVEPRLVTPNGDGRNDKVTVAYRLRRSATVTATLIDAAGTTVATLFTGPRTSGRHTFRWDGSGLPDGPYRVVVASGEARAAAAVLVDRTLAAFAAVPAAFSPNGDGRSDSALLTFTLASPAQVEVRLLRAGRLIATLSSSQLQPGPQQVAWDGSADGKRVPDGSYQAVVTAKDSFTTLQQEAKLVVDTKAPVLRLVSLARLSFWLSEAATVTADLDGQQVVKAVKAGAFRLTHSGAVQALTATAEDAAGNVSVSVRAP